MPYGGPPSEDIGPTQGIAGGPGPTPSGVDDGMPKVVRPGETPEPLAGLPPAEAQRDEGEVAERSAGTRRAEIPEAERDARRAQKRARRGARGKRGGGR